MLVEDLWRNVGIRCWLRSISTYIPLNNEISLLATSDCVHAGSGCSAGDHSKLCSLVFLFIFNMYSHEVGIRKERIADGWPLSPMMHSGIADFLVGVT